MLFYLFIIIAIVMYGFASVHVVKQGGKYALERGGSYKKGMIFPAIVMAIPPVVLLAVSIVEWMNT